MNTQEVISAVLVGIVALIHIYILYLEMFLWNTPKGLKTFGMTQQVADHTKQLATNQGLYNGFLAAGLIWGLCYPDEAAGRHIQMFFLICVLAAGLYGGITVKRSILVFQALPALVALIVLIAVA